MAFPGKTHYALVRGGINRNELVGIISRPDERPADCANLAMVGENDPLAGLSHHGAMNGCLVRIVRRHAVLGVGAVNSNERFVEKRLVNIPLRLVSHEGEPVTAEIAASHRYFYFGQMAEFHRNVNFVS